MIELKVPAADEIAALVGQSEAIGQPATYDNVDTLAMQLAWALRDKFRLVVEGQDFSLEDLWHRHSSYDKARR